MYSSGRFGSSGSFESKGKRAGRHGRTLMLAHACARARGTIELFRL